VSTASGPEAKSRPPRPPDWLWIALVVAAACLPMLPSLGFDLVWDDRSAIGPILDTHGIGDWLAVWTAPFDMVLRPGVEGGGYYRPIIVTTLMLDRALFGEWLPGYHLTNIAWYAATCAFLWLFLRELGAGAAAATLGALLYALHPVHAESVCLITGRVDLVAGAFLVAALWLAARGPRANAKGEEPAWHFAPAIVLALAMFSKEVGLLGAPVVALVAWLRMQETTFESAVRASLPVVVAGVVALAARFSVSGLSLGRDATAAASSVSDELLTGFGAFGAYMQWLFTATGLAARHEMPTFSGFDVYTAVGILALVAVVGSAAFGVLARAKWSVAPALIATTLVPLSWSPLLSSIGVAERLLYVPSAALAVIVALLPLRAAIAVSVLGIGFFSLVLPDRVAVWRDQTTLFESNLRDSGETAYLHNVLAVEYTRQSKSELAHAHLSRAQKLEPTSTFGVETMVDVLVAARRFEEARPLALQWLTLRPNAARAAFILGAIELSLGKPQESVDAYRRALALGPQRAAIHFGLATALEARRGDGDLTEALGRLTAAEQIEPTLGGLPEFRRHLEAAIAAHAVGATKEGPE
jgi:hypothetical protein